ncbi:MAG: twin-arginine translocation signal domain-containing protein, partial [Candidatus Hydrogenedentota bacterium]
MKRAKNYIQRKDFLKGAAATVAAGAVAPYILNCKGKRD